MHIKEINLNISVDFTNKIKDICKKNIINNIFLRFYYGYKHNRYKRYIGSSSRCYR